MALVLHSHPLSSFCWKVLIALYEKDLPFEAKLVDFGDADAVARLTALWPVAKMPVLEDGGEIVPETSIIVEYLDLSRPGTPRMIPADPAEALKVRAADRFYDLYVQVPMQRIVGDRLRPEGQRDPFGVAEARRLLATGCGVADGELAERQWAGGSDFSLADCAAAPALFYADKVMPLGGRFPNAAAYLERVKARPSFARVLAEAEPWLHLFPEEPA